MATYTSSQSGNFSSSSTWGGSGVPGDGDAFNVSSGHTVTIDSGISIPTNGYTDSNVYGILQSQSGTSNTLRMNGRLYVQGGGGVLHLRSGAKIQINGTSGDQHGIWIENSANANLIMEGSDGMNTTTTTSALSVDDEYIPVSSSSGFAVGDHIAIFDITTTYTGTDWKNPPERFDDEGFWIHDISSNNIYVRHYVSPETTIQGVRGNTHLMVENAKVFREGQKIIFNTGSDRNVHTISKINYPKNMITLDGNIVNKRNQTGETIYLTAMEKKHVTSSKIRKCAAVTTAQSSSTATSITVSSASDFSVGDEIYIERQSEADGSTDYSGYWSQEAFKDQKHTISSISGNTITVSSAFDYTVLVNSRVVRLTRDIVCETVATDGSDYGFLYMEHRSSWNRQCIIKDVYFKNWGNGSSNNYTGVVLRGLNSHDPETALGITMTETIPERKVGSWIEGIVVHCYPDNAHERDWGPLWLYDCRSATVRCSITMHGDDGLSTYYEPGYAIFNNITTASDGYGMRLEGLDNVWEVAYNHTSRVNYGYRIYSPYSSLGKGFHSNSSDAANYAYNMVHMTWCPNVIYKCKFTGQRYGINSDYSGGGALYTEIRNLSGYPQPYNDATTRGTTQEGQYRSSHMYQGAGYTGKVVEHNFEYDQVRIYGYRWEAFWDIDENAWRFFRRYDSGNMPGLVDMIYVPAGTTLRLSAKVKADPSFSGTRPYLGVADLILSQYSNTDSFITRSGSETRGSSTIGRFSGYRSNVQYSTAFLTDYEEKQLTYGPFNYPTYVMASVYSTSSNAAEGFWIKDFRAMLDHSYASPAMHMTNRMNSNGIVQVRDSFTKQKKRLGGRLR